MEYSNIKYVDKQVSRIVFGCAMPKMIAGEDASELLDAAFEEGITTFDTAENYGLSEVSLGNWIKKRKNRDKLVIISKGCHPYETDRVTPDDLKKDISKSFKQLGTDYIDVYMLHRDDLKIEVGPMVEILNEYHKAGRIGAFGVSNWTHERIDLANKYAMEHGLIPINVSSPNFGIADQIGDPWGGGAGCVTISGSNNIEARNWYRKSKIPVFAYSSLGRGMFSGRVKSNQPDEVKNILDVYAIKGYCYPENFERLVRVEKIAAEKHCTVAQAAIAWILNQDFEVFSLISMSRKESIYSNVAALDIKLTKEEVAWMDLC